MSRAEIANLARHWLGTPYRHQASTLGAGCDCLGLVRGVWRMRFGTEPQVLPPYRADWRDACGAATLLEAAECHLVSCDEGPTTGQVVLFRMWRGQPPRHCGIMIAPGRFAHAVEQHGVIEAWLGSSWRRRVAGIYDFPQNGA